MLSDEWLSRYGLLENFNASVTRTRTGTGTWTTEVTAIALCTSCSRAKNNKSYYEFEDRSHSSPVKLCLNLIIGTLARKMCSVSTIPADNLRRLPALCR